MNSFEWQGGTSRADRPFLGAIADDYQEIRPGYGDELVKHVLRYIESLEGKIVEVGAGTGKATDAFLRFVDQIDCIEPDQDMAKVLRARYPTNSVTIHDTSFENWRPTEHVSLIYSAQAWHWLDPETRCARAFEALAPGGTLALFGHRFLLIDSFVESRIDAVYEKFAPELLGDPTHRRTPVGEYWYTTEMITANKFVDIEAYGFDHLISYEVGRYIELVATFSSHRALPPAQLQALLSGLRRALQAAQEISIELGTVLVLGRRPRH